MDHNSKKSLLSEFVNTQSFKEVYNYENLASKVKKKKANFLSTEAVRLYELGSLMTSISHLIKHVAFLKSKPFYLLMHKHLQTHSLRRLQLATGILWRSDSAIAQRHACSPSPALHLIRRFSRSFHPSLLHSIRPFHPTLPVFPYPCLSPSDWKHSYFVCRVLCASGSRHRRSLL